MKEIFRTNDSVAGLILRLTLGVVMLPHGIQALGGFGGRGFFATVDFLIDRMNLPWLLVVLVVLLESVGAVALLFGFLTRFAAFGIASIMVGAVTFMHWRHGFFMNWVGQPGDGSFEYHVLALGIALTLVIHGGGRYSIDRVIARKLET